MITRYNQIAGIYPLKLNTVRKDKISWTSSLHKLVQFSSTHEYRPTIFNIDRSYIQQWWNSEFFSINGMTTGQEVPYHLLREIQKIFLLRKNPDFRINPGMFHQWYKYHRPNETIIVLVPSNELTNGKGSRLRISPENWTKLWANIIITGLW